MTTQKSISIAMATYNGSKYITEQLDSLANQELLPAEIVITDDSSTDTTLEKVAEFSKNAPFPIHMHVNSDRLGYRKNFLKAASLCTSDLIAFCDQDDIWHPQKLKVMEQALRDPDVLMACHNSNVVDDNGHFIRLHNPDEVDSKIILPMADSPWKFTAGFTQVFRRDLLKHTSLNSQSYDPNTDNDILAHDQWFSLLASLGTKAYIGYPLADYRQHGGNLCGAPAELTQSIAERLHLKVEDRARLFTRLERASVSIVGIFEELAASEEDGLYVEKSRITEAVKRWKSLSKLYTFRARSYTARSFFERLKAVMNLAKLNAYNHRDIWSFGKKSFARDILLGVIAGPMITSLGANQSLIDASIRSLETLL